MIDLHQGILELFCEAQHIVALNPPKPLPTFWDDAHPSAVLQGRAYKATTGRPYWTTERGREVRRAKQARYAKDPAWRARRAAGQRRRKAEARACLKASSGQGQ